MNTEPLNPHLMALILFNFQDMYIPICIYIFLCLKISKGYRVEAYNFN